MDIFCVGVECAGQSSMSGAGSGKASYANECECGGVVSAKAGGSSSRRQS